jgi:hypothetical protein
MIRLAKFIFVALLVSIFTGCASGPQFSGVAPPASDLGDVYLYRTSTLFAMAQAFDVSLDGKPVGSLYDGSYLHLRLPAGKYALRVSPGGSAKISTIEIQPELGRAIHFQFDYPYDSRYTPLSNFAKSSIQPRSSEIALQALTQLKSAK